MRLSFLHVSKLTPWYTVLLPVFFIFHGYLAYYPLVPPMEALILLAKYLGVMALVVAISWCILRSVSKSCLFAFLVLTFYFFFGAIQDQLRSWFPGSFISSYSFILSLAFILLLIILLRLKKRNVSGRAVLYLNVLLLLLILLDLGRFLFFDKRPPLEQVKLLSVKPAAECATSSRPDVYLIVVDEYAGREELKDVFGFDNTVFLNGLQSRKFFVAGNSRSNYNYTLYSMASVFAMDYLNIDSMEQRADPAFAYRKMLTNPVVSLFQDKGYEFYNQSWFDFSKQAADFPNPFIPARTKLITSQTLAGRLEKEALLPLANRFGFSKIVRDKRNENLVYNRSVEAALRKIAAMKTDGPRFVYSHFSLPHYPFYVDSLGRAYDDSIMKSQEESDKTAYLGYLKYSNGKLLSLVDTILLSSKIAPVIILMSDHGFRKHGMEKQEYDFMNLFSVYLPDGDYAAFSDSESAVNVFRSLFNKYFCTGLPLLPYKARTIQF